MLNDHRGLWKRLKIRQRPGPLVGDQSRHLKTPCRPIDWLDVHYIVIGVELWRSQDHRGWVGRRQLARIEQQRLHAIIEAGYCKQSGFDRFRTRDVATGQHDERTKGKSATDQAPPFE